LGFMAILIIALDQFGLHEWIVEKIRGKKWRNIWSNCSRTWTE
jgi:hypothetical protein